MTDADKVMNPQRFGRRVPADIRIQIWINLTIRIRILDQLLVEILALEEVCLV